MIEFIGFLVNLIEGIQTALALGGKDLFQMMINNRFAAHVMVLAAGFEFVWILTEIILEDDFAGGVGQFVKGVLVASFCWIAIQPTNYDKIATAITNGSDMIVAQIGSVSKTGAQTPTQIIAESIGNGMRLKGDYATSNPKSPYAIANPNSPSAQAAAALPLPGHP